MRYHPTHRGFTLLELVVVMLIIATALAVAAPSMRGWSKGAKLRDEADQFLSVTRWARTQSVATATPYRMVIEAPRGRYWLTRREGTAFVSFDDEFGQVFQLPNGFGLEFAKGEPATDRERAAQSDPVIDFTPLGKTDVAQVRLISDRGQTTMLACVAPNDIFRRVNQPEAAR